MLPPDGFLWIGLIGAFLTLLYALLLSRLLKRPLGGSSGLHRAKSLLKQSGLSLLKWHSALLLTLLVLGGGILLALGSFGYLRNPYLPVAFLTGGLCAFFPQLLDLRFVPRWAAQSAALMEASRKKGLVHLLTAGKVRAFATLGLTLLELSGWVLFLTTREGLNPAFLAETLLTFTLGSAVVAFYARHLGLFSAAALLGSPSLQDAGREIPPEDLRNPSSAAQALGTLLYDPAAGLCAAWLGLLPAAMALGSLTYGPEELGSQAIFYPLLITGAGALASLLASLRGFPGGDALGGALYRRSQSNLLLTLLLTAAVAMPFSFLLFGSLRPWLALVLGLLCALAVIWSVQLSALAVPEPLKEGGKTALSTWLTLGLYGILPLLLLLACLLGAFCLAGGATSPTAGLYGVALAGVGFLVPMGDLLTCASCGTLAQGAIALTWMSGDMPQPTWAPALDKLSDRFSAESRGYSFTASILAAFLLALAWAGSRAVSPAFNLPLVGGILLGLALALSVPALLLIGSRKATDSLREETHRQDKEIKGLRSGKVAPHALTCVDQTTIHSLLWTLCALMLTLALSLLTGALLNAAVGLGLALTVVLLALLPGFFLITAGDHWMGTPLSPAILPLRWAVGPALGEMALLVLAVLLTLA